MVPLPAVSAPLLLLVVAPADQFTLVAPPIGWFTEKLTPETAVSPNITLPPLSPTTQKLALGQEIDRMPLLSTLVAVHPEEPPAVGVVEENTLPNPSAAAQNELEGQDIAKKPAPDSTLVVAHEEEGFVVEITFPKPSTATHIDALAHDTALMRTLSITEPDQLEAFEGVEDATRAWP